VATGSRSAPVASAPDAIRSARLVGADGTDVGGLRVERGTRAEMTVWLDAVPVGGAYRCEVVLADGTRRSVGTWTPGAPGERWTVGLDDSTAGARRVEIVTPGGSTVAAATL
jgi:hypothetical protein